MSQNTDDGEEETTQPNCQSLQLNTDHPYGLGFDSDLADRQRQQYEKEMCRTGSSKYKMLSIRKYFYLFIFSIESSSKGGVRLRACSKPTGTSSSDKSYPVVHVINVFIKKIKINFLFIFSLKFLMINII
jgi:hypothetical protein